MGNTALKMDTPETPTTESVLAEMLTENTGRHMLDSGGEHGRHWQRNQGAEFDNQPAATVDKYGFHPTLNVYHWLLERVDFAPEMDAKLQAFVETPEMERECGLVCMEAFVEEHFPEATGIYGDGKPFTVNTYNGECSLSQTLQFHFFRVDDETSYIALQIHGGADVRGGYTMPKVFEITDDDAAIFSFADVSAHCDNDECEASWYSDNGGYKFYANDREEEFQGDEIKANEDGHYVCPECGKGHLQP
jgi:hypothetical protein